MVKSLILSALLSFSSVNVDDLFLNRSLDNESYSFHIDYEQNYYFESYNEYCMKLDLSFLGDNYSLLDEYEDNIVINNNNSFYFINAIDTDLSPIESITYNYDASWVEFFANTGDTLVCEVMEDEIIYLYNDSSTENLLGICILDDINITGLNYYQYLMLSFVFSEYLPTPEPVSLLSEIGNVLIWVPSQFVTLFSALTGVFYSNGALTLPGLFLVISLGVFICALILDFILKFRKI